MLAWRRTSQVCLPSTEARMTKWVKRWNSWIAPRPSRPGVWRRREGGCLVRKRVTDPRTGAEVQIRMNLPDADPDEALRVLQDEVKRVRQGLKREEPEKIRFRDFSVSLLERKIDDGTIASAKSRQTWGFVLRHLWGGETFQGRRDPDGFGDYFMDEIRRADVVAWRAKVAEQVKSGELSPRTANGWLRILRVVMNSYVFEHELERNPILGVKDFDTSTRPSYTEEEPNSLLLPELQDFLALMARHHPAHYAMTALGFALGARPSLLRPLRRKGPEPDVLWDRGVILIRRSQTVGAEVMNKPKTGLRQRIALPKDLMEILEWHAERLPKGPMRESDLLFPSEKGGFRSSTVLSKPFADVATRMKLTKTITARAMRRTYQDLCRAAEVEDKVTRAISGHATEEMQIHYSTFGEEEIRQNLGKVVSLAGFRQALSQRQEGLAGTTEESGLQSGLHDDLVLDTGR